VTVREFMERQRRRVVDLREYRERDLAPRERNVLARIRSGEANCGLCGDLGALRQATNEPVACMACGKFGEPERPQDAPTKDATP
jgi:hypothetical protein